jgi:hypothetical protein
MLTADKNANMTEFQIQTMQIREKELNYFVSLYGAISGRPFNLLTLFFDRYRSFPGWVRVQFFKNEFSQRHKCGV